MIKGLYSFCRTGAAAMRLDDLCWHFTAGLRPRLTQIPPLRGCAASEAGIAFHRACENQVIEHTLKPYPFITKLRDQF